MTYPARMETITIELAPDVARAVREAARAEGWPSAEDFVRDLIEDWHADPGPKAAHTAYVRAKVREALDDPRPDITIEELDARLRRTIENASRRAA